MNKNFWIGLTIGLLTLNSVTIANATQLTSKINMDNGFVAYISSNDYIQGTAFGSGNNWPATIVNSTTLAPGQDYYLHIYGYDQGWIAGFLGEFSLTGTDHKFANGTNNLLTNTTDWQVSTTGWNGYNTPTNWGINGSGPWGYRSAVSPSATWIWSSDAYNTDKAYFSTKISAIGTPLPGAAACVFFGSGLAGLVGARRKKK